MVEFWDLYGPRDPEEFDDQAYLALARGDCVRSGSCCRKAPCPVAAARGEAYGQRCSYLVGDVPGEFACQLALDGDKELIASVGIGSTGCSDPRNMDRLTAGRSRTKARRLALAQED